jgi:type II secretory pathway pseudopilin PulG
MKNQNGISLLEVVVAVIILSFASSVLIMNSKTSGAGDQRTKIYGEVTVATREVLDALKLLPLDSLSKIKSKVQPHSQSAKIVVTADVRGVLATDVDNFASIDTSTLRYVSLSTSFPNKAGIKVAKVFSTIIYKP